MTTALLPEYARKARPTEYKGTRYRSKSEAIFAYMLDRCGHPFEYEPQSLRIDGWVPDFAWVWQLHAGDPLEIVITEYKPATPTDTYLNELFARYDELKTRCGSLHQDVTLCVNAGTVWGSTRDRCTFARDGTERAGVVWDKYDGWLIGETSEIIDQAKRHRFDLKHNGE